MAQIIKRPFKSYNGIDWDEHYFKTSADQVIASDNKTVENKLSENAVALTVYEGGISVPYDSRHVLGKIYKVNNFVTLDGLAFTYYQPGSNGFGSGSVVGILSTNYRPKSNVRVFGIIGRAGSYPASYEIATITTAGNIAVSLYNNMTAFENITLSNITYYIG